MGKLTTHVLDTSAGVPGGGMSVTLYRIVDDRREQLIATTTNDDGRCDAPLLDTDQFTPGTYELAFDVASYFAESTNAAQPPFLDIVTLRVTLADDAHYHVPLLVSPWSYSTYRGS